MFIYKMSIEWCLLWCCMQELYLDGGCVLCIPFCMLLVKWIWYDRMTHKDRQHQSPMQIIFVIHFHSQSFAYTSVLSFILRKSQVRFSTRITSIIIMDFASFAVTIIIVVNIIWHKYSMNDFFFLLIYAPVSALNNMYLDFVRHSGVQYIKHYILQPSNLIMNE